MLSLELQRSLLERKADLLLLLSVRIASGRLFRLFRSVVVASWASLTEASRLPLVSNQCQFPRNHSQRAAGRLCLRPLEYLFVVGPDQVADKLLRLWSSLR